MTDSSASLDEAKAPVSASDALRVGDRVQILTGVVANVDPRGSVNRVEIAIPREEAHPGRGLKKPGPKGRGKYKKRTIDLPPDLDEFIEHARRNHVRPSGQPSTAYSHFVEDVIAAERNRRAKGKGA